MLDVTVGWPIHQTCDNCCFALFTSAGDGECHRRPPVVVVVPITPEGGGPHLQASVCWPEIEPGDWCGEYEAAS